MPSYALQVIQAPASEPLTLEEAKRHLRLDGDAEDALIATHIAAAREYAEAYTGRQLVTARYRLLLDREPVRRPHPDVRRTWTELRLPRPQLRSVEVVRYRGADGVEVTLGADRYAVDVASEPGRLVLLDGWPGLDTTRPGAFVVEFTAGYGAPADVPAALKAGMLLHVGHLFQNRELAIVGVSVTPLPMAIDATFGPFRVFGTLP